MTDVDTGGPLGLHSLQPPASDASDASDAAILSAPQLHDASSHFDDRSSQGSSLSHHSQPVDLKHAASHISAFTAAAVPAQDLTPPSSNASLAPEDEHPSSHGRGKHDSHQAASLLVTDVVALRHDSHSPHSSSSREGIAGSKRTAAGEVKAARDGDYTRPSTSDRFDLGHARTTSTVSIGSSNNVTEISSQLRTKLKYAMLKVQNGWQTRSLDELESIASASPRSTVSGFQHLQEHAAFAVPQSRARPSLHRKWSDSASSESNPSDVQVRTSYVPPADAPASKILHSSRSLAPPADIKAGARRRPTPNEGVMLSGMTASPIFNGRSSTVRPSVSQRTPSQSAAMEADAVETLLFMASPNNSGYHPPSQASQESSLRSTLVAQTSPLRAQFSQTSVTSPKKVAFSEHAAPGHFESREAQIDHLLETLPDDSDDELSTIAVPIRPS